MIARRFLGGLCALLLMTEPVAAQEMTVDQARAEGRAMAQEKRNDSSLVPSSDAQAAAVPGYTGTSQPQTTYYDDPDKLVNDAQALKGTSEQYTITTDPGHARPTFSNAEILATTNRGTTVEGDPSGYLAGEAYGGTSGSCTPLPPGSGTSGYYEASCNAGSKVTSEARTCSVTLDVSTQVKNVYTYYAGTMNGYPNDGGVYPARVAFEDEIASGVCWESKAIEYCDSMGPYGYTPAPTCKSLGHRAVEVKCTAPATGLYPGIFLPGISLITGQYWFSQGDEPVPATVTRNETMCAGNAADNNCTLDTEVCTSSDPVTRIVNGVPVTQPCWAWQRTYQCNTITTANDCSSLEANGSCTYQRTECLDEDPSGPCKVEEKVYRCPTPSGTSADTPQYICGNDVYCINGDCEPIVREASTEFRDALVGLHALDQAGKEFNEADFKVFTGTRETCHKPVFGLINCCAGKVSGLVPLGAGAAALAGGPAAIAAFATPFLVLFACSQDEMKLDIKDRMGLCHNLGSYCSSSFLGICSTKRTAYCCFESKLSRVLQEQGRPQLGKPWGSAKKEQCQGFTVDEFAKLDLSVMDFTDVYSDFLDAAKLPDELQTMSDIQDKIQAYYDLHGK